jgi:hypothetical protein
MHVTDIVKEILEAPATTVIAATATGAVGVLSKVFDDLPLIHDLLADVSMILGICACAALTRLHWLRGNHEALKNKEFEKSHFHAHIREADLHEPE